MIRPARPSRSRKAFLLPEFGNRLNIASILAFALVPVCWYVIYKTPFGLRLRAAGENPAAADAAGVNVVRLRYLAVVLSGVLAGGRRRISPSARVRCLPKR